MSASKGTDRLAAERRRDLLAAGYVESPPIYPGQTYLWAAPGEARAWRSLTGAWRHMQFRARPPGATRGEG
jgi:hypothetical protein